ncbi:MAG: flagellar biosynthetic protein FliO [Lachnospiraceae bacterium]|nr:flagellar biosynthetic protein FliO [Clostridiales bacterium]MDY3109247.1 flagellar biosynthetic protein FliO [Lachnospiraceae bacterium]
MILNSSAGFSSFMQFLVVLFLFVVVLGITLWTTRWIAGYQKEKMSGSNMEIVDTMRLSSNQYIQIVRIGGEYIAIAVSKDSVTKLAEIPSEQIILRQPSEGETLSFKELFEKTKGSKFWEKTNEDKNE